MKIDERGQITIPKEIRESCGLTPGVEVEVMVRDGAVVLERKRDAANFDAEMKRWRGSLRQQMLADGYTSTRELMQDLRGR
jgi:AbrB family looped-hinge helix DNA binding protein